MRDSCVVQVRRGDPEWLVCAITGRPFTRLMRPMQLPTRVRDAVSAAGAAFFHAVIDRDQVVFEKRYVGDPGWL